MKLTPRQKSEFRRYGCAVIASIIMAFNIKSFVRAGNLFPGGFTGLTILFQSCFHKYMGLNVPYSIINLPLNLIPIYIGVRYVGKRFTISSCLVIVLTSFLTDLIPAQPITHDVMLASVFGGLISGVSIALCLIGNTSSGGTDFIAIYFSEKKGKDIWDYILGANAIVLAIAGLLFGWDKALYSIIFQFFSTQAVTSLHKRYKKNTLFIVTHKPEEIYAEISHLTNHSATIIRGEGCFSKEPTTILYSVVSTGEAKFLQKKVREIDPSAFINIIKTDYINGRFYQKTDY